MKKFCLICFASSAFAILPPLAQSTKEIKGLLADHHLYELLGGGEMIQEIIRNENGYLVITQHYQMQVDIQYLPNKNIGPVPFTFTFQEPVRIAPISMP